MILAMLYDWRQYRVPNWLIGAGLGAGLLRMLVLHGMAGLGACFAGIGITLLVLFPFSAFRLFGAGDVKLFLVVAAFYGSSFTLQYAVLALFTGAIFSIGTMLWHRNLLDRLRYLASYLYILVSYLCSGKKGWHHSVADLVKNHTVTLASEDMKKKGRVIPFAVPMGIAYFVAGYFV